MEIALGGSGTTWMPRVVLITTPNQSGGAFNIYYERGKLVKLLVSATLEWRADRDQGDKGEIGEINLNIFREGFHKKNGKLSTFGG